VVDTLHVLGAAMGMAFLQNALRWGDSIMLQERFRGIRIGEHGGVVFGKHIGRRVILSDGTKVEPGDVIGYLGLAGNLGELSDLSDAGLMKVLGRDLLQGFIDIKTCWENGDERVPQSIVAFTGVSHLGSMRIVPRLGFDVRKVWNPKSRFKAALGATYLVMEREGNDDRLTQGRILLEKLGRVRRVWISSEKAFAMSEQYVEMLKGA